jgi:sugar lactone lactonase YvrE
MALLAAGCGASPMGEELVDLTIVADDSVVDAKLGAVSELDLALSGGETKAQPYPLSRPLARTERVVVHPSVSGGMLTIAASAVDGKGALVATGQVAVTLVPGSTVMATLTLSAPPPNPPKLELLAGALGGAGAFDGTADGARFWGPGNLALDGAGNLFVSDGSNGTIRKVSLADSAVTTVAGAPGLAGATNGNGSMARFGAPRGIAFDGAGNLYISEYSNSCIRKLVPSTGEVKTLAGKCGLNGSSDGIGTAAHFYAPHGLTVDNNFLYVADTTNCTIRSIDLASTQVKTIAGSTPCNPSADGVGTAAHFDLPYGLTGDGQGTLYVTDAEGNTIRQLVIATTVVTTIAGKPNAQGSDDGVGSAARFNDPTDLALDGAGNLYVADAGNAAIRKIELATATVSTVGGGRNGEIDGSLVVARFFGPRGLVYEKNTNALYVADFSGDTIRRVDLGPRMVSTIAGKAAVVGNSDGIGPGARFNQPNGPAADDSGNLYFCDTGNHAIRQLDIATDTVTAIAGMAGTAGSTDGTGAGARFRFPAGLTWDPSGYLFVADTANNEIRQVEISTGTVTTLAGMTMLGSADGIGKAATFRGPQGVTTDGAGNLYVVDTGNNSIRKIVVATQLVTTLAGGLGYMDGKGKNAKFTAPTSAVLDGKGQLWIADSGNHVLRMMDVVSGEVSTPEGQAGSAENIDGAGPAARLNGPTAIALLPSGNLIVADTGNHTLRVVDPMTKILSTKVGVPREGIVQLGDLPAHLSMPNGLVALSDGRIAITSEAEYAVLAVTLP